MVRFEDIDPESRTATLILPAPEVHTARLDHEHTQVYSLDRQGLWLLLPSDEPSRRLVNRAMQEAQAAVTRAGYDEKLITRARDQAELVIRGAMEVVGWRVRIVWAG